MTEQDRRVQLFNMYTQTPHGNLGPAVNMFGSIRNDDGLFFQHLVPWVSANSNVRDHKVAAIVAALTSDYATDRNIGLALYRQLPVRLAAQVVRYIKDSGQNAPRSLRTETARYLRDLQSDPNTFDRVAAGNREDVKYLFAALHISPNARTQRILFDGEVPENTVWWAIREAAQSDDPAERARLVVEYQIPALVATSLVTGPEGVVALVDAMTPAQVQNALQSLKDMGAMDNPELKSMIMAKLRKGAGDTRFQSTKREKVKVADAEIQSTLTEVRETVIADRFGISRPMAMYVDISSSMGKSIDLAKRIGPQVAQAAQNGLWAYAFNDNVYDLTPAETLDGWENNFRRMRPMGTTAIGSGVDRLMRQGVRVEQMLFITDQEENRPPRVQQTLQQYREQFGDVNVIVAHIGNGYGNDVEAACNRLGMQCSVYRWNGDYTALDNLMQLLTGKSTYDLVNDIMDWPIPERLDG